MKVHVRVLVTPQQVLRYRTFEVELSEPACVAEALHQLSLEAEELALLFQASKPDPELKRGLAILVNGENVTFRDGLKTCLSDGDRISLIHAIGGG